MIGSYFGIGILFNATKGLNLTVSYYIAGVFGLSFCVILFIMIKEPISKIDLSKVDVYDTKSKKDKVKKIITTTY